MKRSHQGEAASGCSGDKIEMTIQDGLVVLVAYLLGAIPFGYIIVKSKLGRDVRESGSGSIGATNVLRTAGKVGGILTFVLDVAKGMAAVLIAKAISPSNFWIIGAAALAAIIGHILPVFIGFKGGKGVATGVGVFLAVMPSAVLMVLVVFVIVVWLWRYISLGSIIATAAFPLSAYVLSRGSLPAPLLWATVLGALLIVSKHHGNIRRLIQGNENKFTGFSTKAG